MAIVINTAPPTNSTLSGELAWGVVMNDLGSGSTEKKLGYRFLLNGSPVSPWMSFRPKSISTIEWLDATAIIRRALATPFFAFGPNGAMEEVGAAGQVTLETQEYIWDSSLCQMSNVAGPSSSVYACNSMPTPIDAHRLQRASYSDLLTNEILWSRPPHVYMNRDSVQRAYYYGSGAVTVTSYNAQGVQLAQQSFSGNPNKINSCPIGMKYLAVTQGATVAKVTIARGAKIWTYHVKDCDIPAFGEIYFLSRFGGWDTISFAEVESIQGQRAYTEVNKYPAYGATLDELRTKYGRTAANVKPAKFITLKRPGAESEAEAEWLLDLLTSPAHFIRIMADNGNLNAAKFIVTNSSNNVWEDITITGFISVGDRSLKEIE